MNLSFRGKLLTLVGISALSFILILVSNGITSGNVAERLARIEKYFFPKLELGPQLQSSLDEVQRKFLDASVAQDLDLLKEAETYKSNFLSQLNHSAAILGREDEQALRTAFLEYFNAAHDLSGRIIEDETGDEVTFATEKMQAKLTLVEDLVDQVTYFDRNELRSAFKSAGETQSRATLLNLVINATALVFVFLISLWLSRSLIQSVNELSSGFERFGEGDFSQAIPIRGSDELAQISLHANHMAKNLMQMDMDRKRQDWIKGGLTGILKELQGELTIEQASEKGLNFIASYLQAPLAALYLCDKSGCKPIARYGFSLKGQNRRKSFAWGEGPIGQAAKDGQMFILSEVPESYWLISSGLGESLPQAVAFLPLNARSGTLGVIEIALLKPWSPVYTELFQSFKETFSIALEVAQSRSTLKELLERSQEQAQKLIRQEEELRASNEELQEQQEELQQANEELEEQRSALEDEKEKLEALTEELKVSRRLIEIKVEEAEAASRYKSEFLANMSHELRTPLNSIMVLSQIMAENRDGNLFENQIVNSQTIYSSGKDLLNLINEILDLSKVESGRMETHPEIFSLSQLGDSLRRSFSAQAEEKGIQFSVEITSEAPASLVSDSRLVEQILRNFISNAIKFTEKGYVRVVIDKARGPSPILGEKEPVVEISVKDSGIGIPESKHEVIFEAFRQLDESIGKKYGGTGLGLAISQSFARILGGGIHLESSPGKGSQFTLYLPHISEKSDSLAEAQPQEPKILLIEKDPFLAETLKQKCLDSGFNYIQAKSSEEALEVCRSSPIRAIILNLSVPGVQDNSFVEEVQKTSLSGPIPIHIIADENQSGLMTESKSAELMKKPFVFDDFQRLFSRLKDKEGSPRILLVNPESEEKLEENLRKLGLQVEPMNSLEAAMKVVWKSEVQGIILNIPKNQEKFYSSLNWNQYRPALKNIPLIIYTEESINASLQEKLEEISETLIFKSDASLDRLLDEAKLFLHDVEQHLKTSELKSRSLSRWEKTLSGKKVLIVDDDIRNVYSLREVLLPTGVEILKAQTGREALEVLQNNKNVDAVLMDIMMPEMDGIEATRAIRAQAQFKDLPIIALTAKAMKKDREDSLAAGATDFLSKPIDVNQLLSLLRIWMAK